MEQVRIETLADAAGHARRTITRAKRALRIVSVRGRNGHKGWFWELSEQSQHSQVGQQTCLDLELPQCDPVDDTIPY